MIKSEGLLILLLIVGSLVGLDLYLAGRLLLLKRRERRSRRSGQLRSPGSGES